jgi:tRNA(Ile)-lysidine synthase
VTEEAGLRRILRAALAGLPAGPLGVAVSGGSDSVALTLLLAGWAGEQGRRLEAVTVDHGLRAESGAEAALVARFCEVRGIPHSVRVWGDRRSGGNLQGDARAARHRLIGEWAAARGIGMVALGHTLDDQAETFLMRLARGSGVDGLAGMAPAVQLGGLLWLRPLLGVRRAVLRQWLAAQGIARVEDPSNADARFDRVRARAALLPLATLGLGPERLAATAGAMARARVALDLAAAELARDAVEPGVAGDAAIDPSVLRAAPEELRLRVLAGTLAWVAGSVWRPRLASLEVLDQAICAEGLQRATTLHGCVLRPRRGRIAVRREPARVAPPVAAGSGAWDGRWEITLTRAEAEGLTVGALGQEGLAQCPDWRRFGIARETLLTTPALRREGRLVAAPFARAGEPGPFRRVSALAAPWGGRYCVET